jgi:uncharacterized protein (DUF1501 family)
MSFTTRRGFLEGVGLATGGFLLRSTLGEAFAQPADPKFLLMVYFDGGWDQLLSLDPRNDALPQYQRVGGRAPTSGIEPAYQQTAAATPFVDAVMTATGGTGLQVRGNLEFGPAVPDTMLAHANDLCIIRGMNMDTLGHEVGRRYFLTGKLPPAGLAALGSSLNTVVSAQVGAVTAIPNIAISTDSYNQGLAPAASALRVLTSTDLLTAMQPQAGAVLPAASEAAVRRFEDTDDTCEQHGLDVSGLVTSFKSSRQLSRGLAQPANASLFDFRLPAPAALTELFSAFGLNTSGDLTSMRGRAAVAGQAMVSGVSNVVSVCLANSLDDHFELFGQQATSQRDGWDALGRLVAFLKSKQVPGTTKSFFECTSMMVFSEFSRTPLINSRDGRDHHLTSSCLLAGPGIKGNTVFGASSDTGMQTQKWNFATGALDPMAGAIIRPADVHATLLDSMGLSFSHLSNQSPRVIGAVRR